MKKIFFLFTVAYLALIINCAYAKTIPVGDKAPNFSLPDLNGKNVSLQDILKSKQPVAFVFWASWCPECRRQLPEINSVAKKYKGKVQFYSINTNDSRSDAAAYVKREGIDFPALVDVPGDVADSYGIIGVPTVILIGDDGVVKSIDLDVRHIDDYLPKRK
jgi:cytochrome c biogenesis protein CcmG, thiol:disulfide interchange protein DsbE